MLDHVIIGAIRKPLAACARLVHAMGLGANSVTFAGLGLGFLAFFCIWKHFYILGLIYILLNRLCDGVDGELARLTEKSDQGAYLDTVCDFIFYALIVLAFAMADPLRNGLAAAILLTGFMGTGSSFLAFAIMAERRKMASLNFPQKGIYYLGGLTEGFETILFFASFCLFPFAFFHLAIFFASLCFLTTVMRVYYAYRVLG